MQRSRLIIRSWPACGRLVSGALDLALPASCSGCGREGRPLCDTCRPSLDARLGLPGGTPIGLPADIPSPLLQLEWCAPYAGPVRGALHDLKYSGERRLAEPLGEAVARRWARVGVGADLVVPVPVHADRERRRGYDQAALIAAVAARAPRPAVRSRAGAAAGDGRPVRARARRARLERRGCVRGRGPPPARANVVRGRWVLLVDDVVTTGATLAASGEALMRAGARAVSAIAVARER